MTDEETGDSPVVDPVIGTVVAKAAKKAGDEVIKSGLLLKVLGPAADELGEALQRFTAYRTRNVGRIIESADRKSGESTSDFQVHPRVAHRILDDGSYCDDELMAEYLGGMLAGSRTPGGRDDRAVAWSELITSLSAVQIKAHYLLYKAWATVLHGRSDLNLGLDSDRDRAMLDVLLAEFVEVITRGLDLEIDVTLSHVIPGLVRVGLLSDKYVMGNRAGVAENSEFAQVVRVTPSIAGIELFGWAMGDSSLTPQTFLRLELAEDPTFPKPLVNVKLPGLPAASVNDADV
jgi:hypothetical protein